MPKVAKFTQNQVNPVVRQPSLSAPITQQVDNTVPRAAQGFLNEIQNQLVSYEDSKAEEAITNFESEKNNLLFTGDNAFFNTRGENAYKGQQFANEGLDKLRNKLAEDLSPNARRKFMTASSNRLNTAKLSIFRHGAKGLDEFDTATRKATVTNSFETAALNFSDSNIVDSQREIGLRSVKNSAIKNGLPSKEAEESFISLFNSHIIKAAADTDVVTAEQMFEKLEGSFDSHKDKQDTRDYIDKEKKKVEAKHESEIVFAYATDARTSFGKDLRGRQAFIDNLDPEIRKKVNAEVWAQTGRFNRIEANENTEALDDLFDFTSENRTVDQWRATGNNEDKWDKFSTSTKAALLREGKVVTPIELYSEVFSAIKNEDNERVNLLYDQYKDHMSKTDRKNVELFLKKDEKFKPIAPTNPLIRTSWLQINDSKKRAVYLNEFNIWQRATFNETGENPTPVEIQSHIQWMNEKVENDEDWLPSLDTERYKLDDSLDEGLLYDALNRTGQIFNQGNDDPDNRKENEKQLKIFKEVTGHYPNSKELTGLKESMDFIIENEPNVTNINEIVNNFLLQKGRFPTLSDVQRGSE